MANAADFGLFMRAKSYTFNVVTTTYIGRQNINLLRRLSRNKVSTFSIFTSCICQSESVQCLYHFVAIEANTGKTQLYLETRYAVVLKGPKALQSFFHVCISGNVFEINVMAESTAALH